MPYGISIEELTKSLSAASNSANFVANISKTTNQKININYSDFSEHTIFGDARRKLDSAFYRMLNEYPIGDPNVADINNLSAVNIYAADDYKKQSSSFDLWLLDQLSKSSTSVGAAAGSITAGATNNNGGTIPLVVIHRNEFGDLTNVDQITMSSYLRNVANKYEEESVSVIETTPGSSSSFFVTRSGELEPQFIIYDDRFELQINRAQSLENMLPEVLFYDDEEENLKNLLNLIAEEIDDTLGYVQQLPYIKTPSYDDYNNSPNFFAPVLAAEYGVNLYDSADNTKLEETSVQSKEGPSAKELTENIWKRINNSIVYLLKRKGTLESLKSAIRLYGANEKLIKIEEYSVFNRPVLIKEVEYVDIKALYSDGTNYVQTINGMNNSSRVFDFVPESDFTIEARISATTQQNHTIIDNDYFSLALTDTGRLHYEHKIDNAVFVTTPDSSVSSYVHTKDHFMNVAVKKKDDDLTVFLMTLSGNPVGGEDIVFTSSANVNLNQISSLDFDGQGAAATRFPGSDFNGYIQEVRVWSGALDDEDIREHVRNFESISYDNSDWANEKSLSAHWKLREDSDLQAPNNKIINSEHIEPLVETVSQTYNDLTVDASTNTIESAATDFQAEGIFLVGDVITISDATDPLNDGVELTIADVTGSVITLSNHALTSQGTLDSTLTLTKTTTTYNDNTAEPIGFTENRYRHFDDVKKLVSWYPMGLSVDKDKVLLEAPMEEEIDDSSIVSISMKPIDALNRDIHNRFSKIKMSEYFGTPTDLYNFKYEGVKDLWDGITQQYNDNGKTLLLTDLNSFIKYCDQFGELIDGVFPFAEQFIPAKSNLGGEGILIENPILERNKIQRRIGVVNGENDDYIGSPKEDSIFINSAPGEKRKTDDFDANKNNLNPSVVAKKDNEFSITNKYLPGALLFQDSSSGNIVELHPTACTTAHFQGFQYIRDKSYEDRSLTTERSLVNITKKSTVNGPRISEARVAKLLPVKRFPADVATTEIDVTLDNLIINPTSPATANSGFVNGKIRLLSKGQAFNSESPTFRFEFPTSADGTNLFIAEMGDVDAGQGRIIEGIDNTFVTNVIKNDVQMRLTLANVVTSLSAAGPGVTQNQVDDSEQGSLGVVPIRITNLFNNNTQIVRVAINAVTDKNPELLTQLTSQGGVKLTS